MIRLLAFVVIALSIQAPGHGGAVPQLDGYLRSSRLGINHISGVEEITPAERYARALELGAGWNRWPLYWNIVEPAASRYDWRSYDRLVRDDLAQGLRLNVILLGRPAFHAQAGRIVGLQKPIFADGSDTPGEGSALNPDNPWVRFVAAAVDRYRPGGTLAQELGWPDEQGVRVWEIWNEPDHKPFWDSSILDYARLLKTAYIVIKAIDPQATVMFGGLLYPTQDNWLARVLAIIENDPQREEYNWYMDAVAYHNYSYPWRSGWLALVVRQTLIAYGLERPIWMNESGAPVWDEYPGPTWAEVSDERVLRATAQQQAHFFIQSAVHAWAEGVDVVFHHQLYDDCGNQPGGTNFRPHRGELCRGEAICFGDAFGLFRNPESAVCFREHPQPDTPRPSAAAFALVAEVFGQGTLENPQVQTLENRVQLITFDQPERDQRLSVVWNLTLQPLELALPLGDEAVILRSLDGEAELKTDDDDRVALDLAAADCDYFPALQEIDIVGIGGPPLIVISSLAAASALPDEAQPSITSADGEPLGRRARCGALTAGR